MRRRDQPFRTIRSEGALLSSDLLQRIAQGDKDLGGLRAEDYHVADVPLSEAIVRSWNRLVGAWTSFRDAEQALPEDDVATTVTRERWLLVLFDELSYGRLQTHKAVVIEGKEYPVSHAWEQVPIHLVGSRVPLDRRSRGVAGAAGQSPHGLVQELLNRSEERLWGFVSNGLVLRLLRDSSSLTRQAYLEFDLQEMMESEAYSDFVLLWLVCHVSRTEGERPHETWLERWSLEAEKQGTRALESLRSGVERAIAALGAGFLSDAANDALRAALRNGDLSTHDYYRELLRLVYRLLFLFAAEDRGLLHEPHAGERERSRYARFYSTERLRRLAERRRGTQHSDLYEVLRLVMGALGRDDGEPALGLPALGSFLWSDAALPHLDQARIANRDLLEAVRALAFVEERRVLRAVDYRNLGAEELGSVYESLLELHAELTVDAGTFALTTAAGNERKTTGSYYTPTSLISALLESALDPVLEVAAAKGEKGILDLKVVDPACGSGHFLVAAAHRIAKRLASIQTGDEEPSPEATRAALRDVVSRCLYGVDMNPMAVELCKVSLWMEALDPGRPLSFLDAHIKWGNSLIGTTAALMDGGIPDDAFKPIEGDNKEVAQALRKQNRAEREGQLTLDDVAIDLVGALEPHAAALEAADDDTVAALHDKERRFLELQKSAAYEHAKLIADAWCTAFVQRKVKDAHRITTGVVRRLGARNGSVPDDLRAQIRRSAEEYGFFHWEVEFPGVFGASGGGFDCVLGNPPWDTLSPDVKEFFSRYDADIRFQDREGQQRIVEELLVDPNIARDWEEHCRYLYMQAHFFKKSGRYRLFAPGNLGKGDFNVYRMFIETALVTTQNGGVAAQIVPDGLYMGANAAAIRRELFEHCNLRCIYGFENWRETWFNGIDSRTKFCIYVASTSGATQSFRAAFHIRSEQDLGAVLSGLDIEYPVPLVHEFSPDALAIMEFGTQLEIDIVAKAYARWPKFGDEAAGPPHRAYMREVDMGNDRELFSSDEDGLPVYEGRMVAQFDYRAKGYMSGRGRSAIWQDYLFGDPAKRIRPQWYISRSRIPAKVKSRIDRYRIAFCDVASPTNERTLVATLIPPNVIAGHTAPTVTFESGYEWAYAIWLGVANSFVIDFLARRKVGLHMSYIVLDSLPFPRLAASEAVARRVVPLVAGLSCTGPEMTEYWHQLAASGWVRTTPADSIPGITDAEMRRTAQAELDVTVARELFGLTREELSFILETFPIVRRHDEERHGEYRTKHTILEIFDEMAEADARGRPYETRVDPLPANERLAHPPDLEPARIK